MTAAERYQLQLKRSGELAEEMKAQYERQVPHDAATVAKEYFNRFDRFKTYCTEPIEFNTAGAFYFQNCPRKIEFSRGYYRTSDPIEQAHLDALVAGVDREKHGFIELGDVINNAILEKLGRGYAEKQIEHNRQHAIAGGFVEGGRVIDIPCFVPDNIPRTKEYNEKMSAHHERIFGKKNKGPLVGEWYLLPRFSFKRLPENNWRHALTFFSVKWLVWKITLDIGWTKHLRGEGKKFEVAR